MLDTSKPGLYRVLLTMAALSGARSGELLALRWSDVDMPEGRPGAIYIRRTLSWGRLKGEDIRPRYYPRKTAAGLRRVQIAPSLLPLLKEWKLQCPPSPDDLVFPTAAGKPMRRSNALRGGLWPALRRGGLRRVCLHSLRHSFASALIMSGGPVAEVQTLLGHASPAVTENLFSLVQSNG
jgi:integrase